MTELTKLCDVVYARICLGPKFHSGVVALAEKKVENEVAHARI